MTDRLPKNKRKPAKNFTGLSPERSRALSSSDVIGVNSGIAGTKMVEPCGLYNKAECEKVITPPDHAAGCAIVLGRDREHTLTSGYMADGDTQSFAIRLVAGFGACIPGYEGWPKDIKGYWPDVPPDGGPPPLYVNPSNTYDGAILYLSQKCDVDDDFNCATGKAGNIKSRPAAVMKADAVRVISRDGGIKLIANTDRYHGGGERTTSLSTIDFIVNNDDAELQPLAKGENLRELLKDFRKWTKEITVQINNIVLAQMELNAALATHRHAMPDSMLTTIPNPLKSAAGVPVPYTVGEYKVSGFVLSAPEDNSVIGTGPSLRLSTAVGKNNSTHTQATSPNLISIQKRLDDLERDYLSNSGPTYILSNNVNTT